MAVGCHWSGECPFEFVDASAPALRIGAEHSKAGDHALLGANGLPILLDERIELPVELLPLGL